MSKAENAPYADMDKALLRSSQILTSPFSKRNNDLDLFVNPVKTDLPKKETKNKKEPSHEDHKHEDKNKKLSNVTPYLLLFALCLDGFFEGIALGLQKRWDNVLFVAFAIIINKIAVSFSLGVSFKKSNTEIQTFIRFILLFSIFCPFGIVVGYFTISYELTKGILLAFSSGTFIYISCSVNIVEEFAITNYRYTKYIFFLLGGLLTAGIALLELVN